MIHWTWCVRRQAQSEGFALVSAELSQRLPFLYFGSAPSERSLVTPTVRQTLDLKKI